MEDHLGVSLDALGESLNALSGAVGDVLDASTRDHKTPLNNERGLTRVGNEIFDKPEEASSYGVLFGDITDFKAWNSRLGQDGADTVLHAVGSALSRIENSAAFRRGGDEFVVVVKYDHMREVLSAIQNVLSPLKVNIEGQEGGEVHTAFGYTRLDPTVSFQENQARAEKACKSSKWTDGGGPVEWTSELVTGHEERLRCPDCRSQFSISICPERSQDTGPLNCMACGAKLPSEKRK